MQLDIVMPYWGDFGHLREAVLSVLSQEDPDWTLLVLDDVYPDLEPGEWVKGLGDPRITYVRNDTNLGPSKNYTKAVSMVSGDYVMIMGCDDRMLPGYVAKVKSIIAAHHNVDLIQPGVAVIDEHGTRYQPVADRVKTRIAPQPAKSPLAMSGESLAVSLMKGNWTYFPSLVWRRSWVLEPFRPDLNVVQDLARIMDIVLADGVLVCDAEPVFEYRRHSSSVSAKTAVDGSKYAQERTLFAELYEKLRSKGWPVAARAAAAHWTSRLSAAAVLPSAIAQGHWQGVKALTHHVFASTTKPS